MCTGRKGVKGKSREASVVVRLQYTQAIPMMLGESRWEQKLLGLWTMSCSDLDRIHATGAQRLGCVYRLPTNSNPQSSFQKDREPFLERESERWTPDITPCSVITWRLTEALERNFC